MISVLRLEFRKQRSAFLALAAALILTILFALMAPFRTVGVRDALAGLLFYWLAVGVPGSAVLLGAGAGAGLRAAPKAGAEDSLPVSSRKRVAAAALAAAGYLGLVAALVLLAVACAGVSRSYDLLDNCFSWGLGHVLALHVMVAYLLLPSLLCAYLCERGVAGGILGVVLGVCEFLLLSIVLLQRTERPLDAMVYKGLIGACLLLSLLGGLYAVVSAVEWVERRAHRGWLKFVIAVGAIIISPMALHVVGKTTAGGCEGGIYWDVRRGNEWAKLFTRDNGLSPWGPPRTGGIVETFQKKGGGASHD